MTESPLAPAELFWRQGYLHIRGFFEEGEIQNCSLALQKANEAEVDKRSNHWAEQEVIQAMIFSPRVLKLATAILETIPTFFGRALDTYRPVPLPNHLPVGHPSFRELTLDDPKRFLHIDAKGTEESLFAKRSSMRDAKYPVIRFAHYFQDHSRYSYGIKLAPFTHTHGDPSKATVLINPPLRPTDLLVFNLKTVHSAKCLRHHSGKVLPPSLEDSMETSVPHEFALAPVTRNVLAWDFCSMAREAELFIRNRAFYEVHSWHKLGHPLDTVPALMRLEQSRSINVRHDAEIALLRTRKITGELSRQELRRLAYLEEISPYVSPMHEDIGRFRAEILNVLQKS